jgi:hypothetical protein
VRSHSFSWPWHATTLPISSRFEAEGAAGEPLPLARTSGVRAHAPEWWAYSPFGRAAR